MSIDHVLGSRPANSSQYTGTMQLEFSTVRGGHKYAMFRVTDFVYLQVGLPIPISFWAIGTLQYSLRDVAIEPMISAS